MTKNLQLIKKFVLLVVVTFMLSSGTVVIAQTEITVEPGFNTLLDAVNANPGATLILKRGGDYIIDAEPIITVPTIIKGEKEPAATRPAVISFFANPGEAATKVMISVAADFVLQDVGMIGITYDEQQIQGGLINVLADNISITLDGCIFQGYHVLINSDYRDGLTIIEKNNKFFNQAFIGWDNQAGVGMAWANTNIDFQVYNNTYFIGGRALNSAGAGPDGSELMEHNTYVATWGDTYFPNTDKTVTVKNNIYYDAQVRSYVGPRYDAGGNLLFGGDYSDWSLDSIGGDISIYPHLNDSVGDPRVVTVTNNLKMYSGKVLDFYAANNVTPMTFFNIHGWQFAERFGWDVKDNILQEKGNTVDPKFAMGAIPDAAYENMFKQRVERGLPVSMQGPDFPYYLAWIPAGKTKADFIWPMPFDFKPTNEALWKAGDDGYPLGDLNWFSPDVKTAWETGLPNPLKLTGIKQVKSAEFSLKNYPNPFSTSTLISYTLQEQNNVSLMVFNSAGVKIATLVNETQKAGNHEVTFNSANLSNGIYFYKMQAGTFSQIQKMIVAK